MCHNKVLIWKKCLMMSKMLMKMNHPHLLSNAADNFRCPMTFSLKLCHLKAYFLDLCNTIPSTLNVGACCYICFSH